MTETIDAGLLSQEEFSLAVFAQGVLNRKGYKIFIDIDNYISYLKDDYVTESVWTIIEKYKNEFEGAVVYDLDETDVSVNMAATLCAVHDYLGVPRVLEKKVNAMGIFTVYDTILVSGSNSERQRRIFHRCKEGLKRDALVHQVVKKDNFHLSLRDFSIANRWLCVYTDESEEDREFRKEVLEWLDGNSPVYGWNDDEISFIKDVSSYGDYAVPTDWSCNHSYFGQNPHTVKQNVKRTRIRPDKHYVAIVVSDGDNVQWLERDFSTTGTFGQRQRSVCDYKMNWTFSPSLAGLCPDAAEKIFDTKKHDYFISGVSGIGYANCLSYPREHLDAFTEKTEKAMRDSDLDVVCLLDNVENASDAANVVDRLSSYARFDTIKGGIWEMDPDRYGSGKGKIYRAMGKPFVSVRFTMWHPSGNMNEVDEKWLDTFIEAVNSMPVAPDREEGYTVLNVHPWTVSMESLDYVVKGFSDNVELVYADELIELIKTNIYQE